MPKVRPLPPTARFPYPQPAAQSCAIRPARLHAFFQVKHGHMFPKNFVTPHRQLEGKAMHGPAETMRRLTAPAKSALRVIRARLADHFRRLGLNLSPARPQPARTRPLPDHDHHRRAITTRRSGNHTSVRARTSAPLAGQASAASTPSPAPTRSLGRGGRLPLRSAPAKFIPGLSGLLPTDPRTNRLWPHRGPHGIPTEHRVTATQLRDLFTGHTTRILGSV